MSLSAEEKRQLLRERRQAKMAQGKASERLNDILSNGSSVKSATAVSVLDKPEQSGDSTAAGVSTANATRIPTPLTAADLTESKPATPLHGDPEVPDISKLLHQNETPEELDMDAMFLKIFASAGVNPENPQNAQEASTKFFADLMKAMSEDLGENGPSFVTQESQEETTYQQQLVEYQTYQHGLWKARFLFVRFVLHMFNFFYHYKQYETFLASPYSYFRGQQTEQPARAFFMYFISVEIAVISSYFMIMSHNGLLRAISRNNAILKGLSLIAGLYPPIRQLQPLVDDVLVYWSGISILFSDMMYVVVLFGIVSVVA